MFQDFDRHFQEIFADLQSNPVRKPTGVVIINNTPVYLSCPDDHQLPIEGDDQ